MVSGLKINEHEPDIYTVETRSDCELRRYGHSH